MRTLLAAVMVLMVSSGAPASDRGLPFVTEVVDEICVVQSADSDHKRVVFLRDGKVFAVRLYLEYSMQFVQAGDGFQLIFEDDWTAERVVECKRLSAWNVEQDPEQFVQRLPWWHAARNMRDLRQP